MFQTRPRWSPLQRTVLHDGVEGAPARAGVLPLPARARGALGGLLRGTPRRGSSDAEPLLLEFNPFRGNSRRRLCPPSLRLCCPSRAAPAHRGAGRAPVQARRVAPPTCLPSGAPQGRAALSSSTSPWDGLPASGAGAGAPRGAVEAEPLLRCVGWCPPPPGFVSFLEPWNMAVLGNGVICGVAKARSQGSRAGSPSSRTGVGHTDAQGSCHEETPPEAGATPLRAEDPQGPPPAAPSRGGVGGALTRPLSLQRGRSCRHLDLRLRLPDPRARSACRVRPPVRVTSLRSPRKPPSLLETGVRGSSTAPTEDHNFPRISGSSKSTLPHT